MRPIMIIYDFLLRSPALIVALSCSLIHLQFYTGPTLIRAQWPTVKRNVASAITLNLRKQKVACRLRGHFHFN